MIGVILRVPEQDLPRLSSYLQGSPLHVGWIDFDRHEQILRVGLGRQEETKSKASRLLSKLPLLGHAGTTRLLSVDNVIAVKHTWRNPLGRLPRFSHTLAALRLDGECFVIDTDAMTLRARLSSYGRVELRDTAEPAGTSRLADLFGRVGRYETASPASERSAVEVRI